MLNRSRNVICPTCQATNSWEGDPAPEEALHCQYCENFISTHRHYLESLVKGEVARVMARYADPDSAYQLSLLKQVLADQPSAGARL
ncbi:hypothetical protein [Modicisalibacter radicis]|uniref:hypothetical protein n=1 Tax=Halomonas sp. EAR18 TaxID=2518972 RepID=UPI00109D29F5|nr:hypothetical protein [Halomonas sp. EAR18]